MSRPFPTHARIVIVGGGVMGMSIAYHLASAGVRDVVALERFTLTSGSTWHAAGVVGVFKTNPMLTTLLKRSVDLYAGLEARTGLSTGWATHGSLRLACSPVRLAELRRAADLAPLYGVDLELIDAAEVSRRFPAVHVDDVLAASWVPGDGVVNPTDMTQSLARGARDCGVRIVEGVSVLRLLRAADGRICGVETDQGSITCEVAVVTGGVWSRALAATADVRLPTLASYHQYFVTEAVAGAVRGAPFVRDPDSRTYGKEESGGLLLGVYEPDPLLAPDALSPVHQAFQLGEDNWELIQSHCEALTHRFPGLAESGIKTVYNGIESFTADGLPIADSVPEVPGLFVVAGCNANGVALAGGLGEAMAGWIAEGAPPVDLSPLSLDRFRAFAADDRQVAARGLEGQANHYAPSMPSPRPVAGRPFRCSQLHETLAGLGAEFVERDYWEQVSRVTDDPDGVAGREAAVRHAIWFDRSPAARYEIALAPSLSDVDGVSGAVDGNGALICPAKLWQIAPGRNVLSAPPGCEAQMSRWLVSLGVDHRAASDQWIEIVVAGPRAHALAERLPGIVHPIEVGCHPAWAALVPASAHAAVVDVLAGTRLGGLRLWESLHATGAAPIFGLDVRRGDPAQAPLAQRKRLLLQPKAPQVLYGLEPVEIDGRIIGQVALVTDAGAVLVLQGNCAVADDGLAKIIVGGRQVPATYRVVRGRSGSAPARRVAVETAR
ncbi:MAG: FAD-dependent oxidoreductase [Pseudorhodoplanes sp.]|nr:FAD-dependent oxidoreductase [Pseudorhodoplanes sp.]